MLERMLERTFQPEPDSNMVGRLVKYRQQDLDAFILENRIGAEGGHAV